MMNYPLLKQQMNPRIKQAWRYSILITAAMSLVISLGAILVARFFTFNRQLFDLLLGVFLILVTVITVMNLLLIPYRYAFHRYEVTDQDLALQTGYFFRSTTYVPLNRIQHLETKQGPLLRHVQLLDLNISTAATTHTLDGLDVQTAQKLRQQLIALVKAARDDA